MIKRVNVYHDMLWQNFKGIHETDILRDLPQTLSREVKFFLFRDLMESVAIFPKGETAVLNTLIERLTM